MDVEHLLPAAVLRNIGAQQYEKRKLAALEVEQLMKKLGAGNDKGRIQVVLTLLTDDFALSGLVNHRKGGLLCLAAATVGLKQFFEQLKFDYLGQIVRPVAASLSDQDNRVRYYACEALFNITKSMHDEFMTNQPLFIEVFSSLFKLYGDPDEHVQNAATHLDEVLKSIVMSSSEFDVDCFVQMLKGFFKAPDPHKRQFLIGWVTALFSVPELDMLAYLPDIAGGMLEMLVDEHKEIRHAAAKALQEFLQELSSAGEDVNMDYNSLVEVLISMARTHHGESQLCLTSMRWLNTIIEIAQEEIVDKYGAMVSVALARVSHPREEVQRNAQAVNRALLKMGSTVSWESFDASNLLDALAKDISNSQPPTRLESLTWLKYLLTQKPSAVLERMDVVMDSILDALMMTWEEVEEAALQLLVQLGQQEGQFRVVMEALISRFNGREGLKLLHRSGPHILQSLCSNLGCRKVYMEISALVNDGTWSGRFGPMVIQALSVLLVTSMSSLQLQEELRRGLGHKETKRLFVHMFPSWSYSASAALCLCFLSQSYSFAWQLITTIGSAPGGPSYATVSEIIKLVKLLEAPAFTFLRLQLLEPTSHPGLMQSMRGLLMLLPQTEAFRTLFLRLQSSLIGLPSMQETADSSLGPSYLSPGECDALLEIFAERHQAIVNTSVAEMDSGARYEPVADDDYSASSIQGDHFSRHFRSSLEKRTSL